MNKNESSTSSSVKSTKIVKTKHSTKKQKSQKKYQVVEQDWNINQDGVNIYGRLYMPQNLIFSRSGICSLRF